MIWSKQIASQRFMQPFLNVRNRIITAVRRTKTRNLIAAVCIIDD